MPSPKKKYATVADIRTHSKKASQHPSKHKAYLMLSYLEMKRTRLDKEKQMILKRLEAIQKQYDEIDNDKSALLKQQPQLSTISENISSIQANPISNDQKFVIKY